MIVPALLYVAVNAGRDGADGWGIPMATDIAFALGALALAARRAPAGLKPLLLTLAIVDDIGAILVIALFYSDGVRSASCSPPRLCADDAPARVPESGRRPPFVVLGALVWYATYEPGCTPRSPAWSSACWLPPRPFQRPGAVSEEARRIADRPSDHPDPPDADAQPVAPPGGALARGGLADGRLEHLLLPWTSFLIVPLFALANAGVPPQR